MRTHILKKLHGILAKNTLKFSAAFLMICALAPQQARADCINPPGVLGQIIMNETDNVPVFCDSNDQWIAMSGGNNTIGVYIPNAVTFDGSDSLRFTSATGYTNSDAFLISFWIKPSNEAADFQVILNVNNGSQDRLILALDNGASNTNGLWTIYFEARNSSGALVAEYESAELLQQNKWNHVLISVDASASVINSYINDTVDTNYINVNPGNGDINFNVSGYGVGEFVGTGDRLNASLSEMWFESGLYLDLSVEANRRLFINSSNNPVFLGADGSIPTGAQPDIFLSGATGLWNTNKGTGGGFNATGTLSEDTNRPYINKTQIVPNGLIGHWRLDEESGTTAFDSSGNGNHATIQRTAATGYGIPGVINSAFDSLIVDQNSAFRMVADGVFPTGSNPPFSINAWINVREECTALFSNGGAGQSADLNLKAENGRYRLNTPNGWNDVGNAAEGYEKWSLFTLTYDGTTLRYYIDTRLVSSLTQSFTLTSDRLVIGSFGGSCGGGGRAAFDEVRLYNTPLSLDEIAEIYAARDGIRYNSSQRTMEFFDGNRHVSMTPAPQEVDRGPVYTYQDRNALGCPNVGNPCSDGTVYAGTSPDGSMEMFTTPNDLGAYTWTDGTGTLNSSLTDCTSAPPGAQSTCQTGASNTELLATADSSSAGGLQHYEAARACYELDTLGHDDWYLPAQDELLVLYNGRNAIGGFVQSGAFPTTYYWSSSEDTGNDSREINFDGGGVDGWQGAGGWALPVRCVRKGASAVVSGTSGLVGHWKFDETEGTTLTDSSGNGHDGAMQNGLNGTDDRIPGAVGSALRLNGRDTWIDVSGAVDLRITGDLTTSLWLYRNVTGEIASLYDYGESGEGSNVNHLYQLLVQTNNTLSLEWEYGSGSNVAVNSSTPLTTGAGEWVHILVTRDDAAKEVRFYENGVQLGTTRTYTNSPTDGSAAKLFIGEDSGDSQNYHVNGALDDLRIYNRVLQAGEIQTLYQIGAPVGSSTALPQGCPNIGDVCDDGTIYAGLSPDGNVEMYAAAEDEGLAQWRSYGNSRATNNTDGDGNTVLLYSFPPTEHPHAYNCMDKVAHGATDWYWPSRNEMTNIYNGGNPIGGVISDGTQYWASSQHDNNSAHSIRFDTGNVSNTGKLGNFRTRCVRKGPAPRCANPYGLAGQMIYNTTFEVVQYCDGARWKAIGKYEAP